MSYDQPREIVVISDEEFPSTRVVWESLQSRGVNVREVSLQCSDPELAFMQAAEEVQDAPEVDVQAEADDLFLCFGHRVYRARKSFSSAGRDSVKLNTRARSPTSNLKSPSGT